MGQFIFGLIAGIVVGLVMEWVIDWTGLLPKRPPPASSRKSTPKASGASNTRVARASQRDEPGLADADEMRSNTDMDEE